MSNKLPVMKVKDKSYLLRRIAKSGNSRYLSVGTIVPKEWEVVKVYVVESRYDRCILRLEAIT